MEITNVRKKRVLNSYAKSAFFSTGVAKFNIKKERSTIFLQLFFKFLILCRFILTLNLFRVVYVLSPKGGK
jgi:hypothetical protein